MLWSEPAHPVGGVRQPATGNYEVMRSRSGATLIMHRFLGVVSFAHQQPVTFAEFMAVKVQDYEAAVF